MIGKCLACGAKFDPAENGQPDHYELKEPFAAKIITMTSPCPLCRRNHVVAINSARPSVSTCWQVSKEVLRETRDYTWVKQTQGRTIDGKRRLYICWLWVPITDDPTLETLLKQAVLGEDFIRRQDVDTLLVMDEENIPPVGVELMPKFTAALTVKRHVRAGAYGPYASLRAERSLYQTWSGCNLGAIRHYWPGVCLNPVDYVRLGTDASLASAWAQFARRNLSVSTPVE
jgi:hypothetical protein